MAKKSIQSMLVPDLDTLNTSTISELIINQLIIDEPIISEPSSIPARTSTPKIW
jgi:hypothetical protein